MKEEDFFDHVLPNGDCWEWVVATFPNGYGRVRYKGKMMQTHRMAYIFKYGQIPDGKLVCHTCDNPLCINPDHLFLGTSLDNTHDMIKKGRAIYFKGEQVWKHKLKEQQVIDIRSKYASKRYTQQQLADEYKVSRHTIFSIIYKKTWKHI